MWACIVCFLYVSSHLCNDVIFGNSLSFDGFVILRIPPNFILLTQVLKPTPTNKNQKRNKLCCPFHKLYNTIFNLFRQHDLQIAHPKKAKMTCVQSTLYNVHIYEYQAKQKSPLSQTSSLPRLSLRVMPNLRRSKLVWICSVMITCRCVFAESKQS